MAAREREGDILPRTLKALDESSLELWACLLSGQESTQKGFCRDGRLFIMANKAGLPTPESREQFRADMAEWLCEKGLKVRSTHRDFDAHSATKIEYTFRVESPEMETAKESGDLLKELLGALREQREMDGCYARTA